jgi:hypothetical protein
MNILIDECVPRPLAGLLTGHIAKTVRQMGWNGKKNGALLKLAAAHFDLFLTVDKSIRHQQNLKDLKLSLLVLRTKSNKLENIVRYLPEILAVLRSIRPGEIRHIPR